MEKQSGGMEDAQSTIYFGKAGALFGFAWWAGYGPDIPGLFLNYKDLFLSVYVDLNVQGSASPAA